MSANFWICGVSLFLTLVGEVLSADKVSARLPSKLEEDGRMATRLSCQPKEVRHFRYVSETQMWGESGGTVTVSADMAVHCLGEDKGAYRSDALKYLVEISGITSTPSYNSTKSSSIIRERSRQKRGIGDFFKNLWNRIKNFFGKVFGRRSDKSSTNSKSDAEKEKEGTTSDENTLASEDYELFDPDVYNRQYGTPFEFVQLANGSIPEIRFSANDTDLSVRNFKRHLTDLFTTHMDRVTNSVQEVSPLGTHKTKYIHSDGRGNLHGSLQSASLVSVLLSNAGSSSLKDNSDQLKVTRLFDTGDIVSFHQSSKGMNDPREVQLNARQVQQFSDGEMTSSEGSLEFSVKNFNPMSRVRRGADDGKEDDELMNNFNVKTSFTLQLHKRRRRSVAEEENYNKLETQLKFAPHSLAGSLSSDIFLANRLENLRYRLNGKSNVVDTLMSNHKDVETMSIVLEIIQLENKLGLEVEKTSLTNSARNILSPESVNFACSEKLTAKCQDILLIMTNVGGNVSEQITLSFLDAAIQKKSMDAVSSYLINCISNFPKPSSNFLEALVNRLDLSLTTERNGDIAGPLSVSLATLLRESKEQLKFRMTKRVAEELQQRGCDDNEETRLLVRSLGIASNHAEVIKFSRRCSQNYGIEEEVIDALKSSIDVEDVQIRLLEMLESDKISCHLKINLVEMLRTAAKKQDQGADNRWPLKGFTRLDEFLSRRLLDGQSACLEKAIVRYFQQKDNSRSERMLQLYPQRTTRQKRALLDDMVCDDWMKGNASHNEVLLDDDDAEFNRWRWCSGQQSLGRKMANAHFSGGVFAGIQYPSNPPRYKVNAKFKANANFLGRNFDISTASFNVDDRASKANVEVLGRKLLDLKGDRCNQDEFIYRPAEHIPIYALNIWIVEVSLGLHLGVDTTLAFRCPSRAYQFLPKAKLRVGGEATARVLMLRGGINVGGDFNYHLKSQLKPYPEVCFSARRGYDPMNIGIESWFEFWKPWFLSWGGRRTWNPKFLKWDISDSHEENWIRPYCLLADNASATTFS